MTLSIIILAAGKGTRMRSNLPKVMQPLAGRPMLSYVIDAVKRLNPSSIICVVGKDAQPIQDYFRGSSCEFVIQAEQLGTAHAVLQAIPRVKGDRVMVLAGDGPLITAATLQAFQSHIPEKALGVLTYEAADPTGLGRVVRDAKGEVARIVEEKDTTENERRIREVNSGIYIAQRHDWISWLPQVGCANKAGEYYLPDVVPLAQHYTQVQAMRLQDPMEAFGINDMKQLSQAERALQAKQADALMQQGVRLADPTRFDLRGTLTVGKDVFIDVNVIIEGHVSIGNNTQIGAHTIIKDTTIGDNVTIKPFSHIEGATIAANAIVGPFARLRPGAQLSEHVHVGNFVEIKNATLGAHSKANHLSYVGDATVGKEVNIGAGVITCNYDGVNKHHTEIGDNAFIGSNSSLIAPITVGKGATIGAGTVLRKNAPDDQLTVSAVKQLSKEGWRRPQKTNEEGG